METTQTLHQTHKIHGDSKPSIPPTNMAFVKLQRTQSLTRPTTHAAISTFSTSHNSISSPYSQSNSPRVLQHQKQTQYSMLQIKTILKTPFDYRHLTSTFYLYLPLNLARGLTTISEETTQSKHAPTLQPFLANNNNNKNSG